MKMYNEAIKAHMKTPGNVAAAAKLKGGKIDVKNLTANDLMRLERAAKELMLKRPDILQQYYKGK